MLQMVFEVQVITSYDSIIKYTPETLLYNVDESFYQIVMQLNSSLECSTDKVNTQSV